jgi:uncharacterized protein with GYD domain
MAIDFVMLLTLSDNGRINLADAVSVLSDESSGLSSIVSGLGGAIDKWTLTHGQYDAVVVGQCPDLESVTSVVGWIQGTNHFVSQTLIGAGVGPFSADGRAFHQS